MIVCAKIDDDGYFIEDIIIHKGEEIPLNCIKNRPNTKEGWVLQSEVGWGKLD